MEAELAKREQRTRAFVANGNGNVWGDRPYSSGHLYFLLSNPIYAGKIRHKDKLYNGQHEAIIDRKGISTPKGASHRLKVPIELIRRAGEMTIMVTGSSHRDIKPDAVLVKAMARGFTWFEQLSSGNDATIESIARRERMTARYVSRMIELAFLSPEIVEGVLSGKRRARLSTSWLLSGDCIPTTWLLQERTISEQRNGTAT